MSKNEDSCNVPTKQQIAETLQNLIEGKISRDKASTWAFPWMRLDCPEEYEQLALATLSALAASDTPTTDRPYLYDNLDFEEWLRTLQAGSDSAK